MNYQKKIRPDLKRLPFFFITGILYGALWFFSGIHKHPDQFWVRFINELWRAPYIIFLNFILFEFTLRYISWRRIIQSVVLLFLHIMFYSIGLFTWRHLGIQMNIYTELLQFKTIEQGITYQMSYSMGSFVFFGIARHIFNHFKLKQVAQKLLIEKQQAELNYLKSQTNPHFLFNTLNNIYSLSRDKSDLAPESILRLSKILRYMLYEAGGAYIPIEQELKIIDDYIALEKLRYDETLFVNFNYDVEDMKQSLPPLLLIPLVENAFKHGVSETRGKPFVDIHLSVRNRQLSFVVKNSSETIEGESAVKENIGLSNLRRQLELLYHEYDLTVQQAVAVFTASLKINLASHV